MYNLLQFGYSMQNSNVHMEVIIAENSILHNYNFNLKIHHLIMLQSSSQPNWNMFYISLLESKKFSSSLQISAEDAKPSYVFKMDLSLTCQITSKKKWGKIHMKTQSSSWFWGCSLFIESSFCCSSYKFNINIFSHTREKTKIEKILVSFQYIIP